MPGKVLPAALFALFAFFALPATGRAADTLVVFRPGDTARASAVNANFKTLWDRLNAAVSENQGLGRKLDSLLRIKPPAPNPDSLNAKIAGKGSQLPIGTIVPSVLPPKQFEAYFDSAAWVLADGGRTNSVAYISLFNVDRLPDLRGVFLRGMNMGRADSLSDPGGERTAGAGQGDATRFPRSGFTIGQAGSHAHSLDFETSASRAWNAEGAVIATNTVASPALAADAYPSTLSAGAHTHSISGGDSETRPKNAAVFYYIKVR